MHLITTTKELEKFCTLFDDSEFIVIDTEFMRERTYWSHLCLIQVASAEHAAIIDPLAPEIDLTAFKNLLYKRDICKVFHAGRQDIEIFYHLYGAVPSPIFDSQVAAMVCGLGDQPSYELLVKHFTDATIDKSSRFTDWSKRPLTEQQLEYALSDVTHLAVIYPQLKAMLAAKERESWISEEMDILTSPSTYDSSPHMAWKRLKTTPRNEEHFAALRGISTWREFEAQKRNVPRGRILKDVSLTQLALQSPLTIASLNLSRACPRELKNSAQGAQLLKFIDNERQNSAISMPERPKENNRKWPKIDGMVDMLKLYLKLVSEQEKIASRLIATSPDLTAIALGKTEVPALKGWRGRLFGENALKLCNGKLAITLEEGKLKVINRPPSDN